MMPMELSRMIPKKVIFSALVIGLMLVMGTGVHFTAIADGDTTPASCVMSQYGFTTGLVYCFKQTLSTAATQYIGAFSSFLVNYFWGAVALALTLFGVRLVTQGSEELLKEIAMLVFKIAIAAYIFYNASSLYTSLSGAMSELIGYVSTTFSSISNSCGLTPPPDSSGDYQVWMAFDCMSQTMFGAVSGSNSTGSEIYHSMAAILVAAAATNTLGIIATFLGINLFFGTLFMIIRALYVVLLAYMALAFMMIIAPLIAPFLMFSSHRPDGHTRQIFDRWAGLILSTLFEPMFVIGFLAIAVQVMDTFIDTPQGQGATACSTGQICSFHQLFAQCESGTGAQMTYQKCLEPGPVLFSYGISGDPTAHSNGSDANGNFGYTNYGMKQVNHLVTQAYQFLAVGGNMELTVPNRIRQSNSGQSGSSSSGAPSASIAALILTLIAALLTGYVMYNLLQDMAKIARRIAGQVGLALFEGAQLPFEKMLEGVGGQRGALADAETAMLRSNGQGNAVARAGIDAGKAAFQNIEQQGL